MIGQQIYTGNDAYLVRILEWPRFTVTHDNG